MDIFLLVKLHIYTRIDTIVTRRWIMEQSKWSWWRHSGSSSPVLQTIVDYCANCIIIIIVLYYWKCYLLMVPMEKILLCVDLREKLVTYCSVYHKPGCYASSSSWSSLWHRSSIISTKAIRQTMAATRCSRAILTKNSKDPRARRGENMTPAKCSIGFGQRRD